MLDFNARTTLAGRFVEMIDQATPRQDKPRTYLGGSAIGEPCTRRLQYDFTGAARDDGKGFAPQTLRIFHRGHKGEQWMADWIRAAGFDLRTERKDGSQFGFKDCDGQFRGHIDGVFVGGPDAFTFPALWENKVLGNKGWTQLERHGLAKAYPAYAAQVATYQAYMSLAEHPAIFTALNADTMAIHVEIVPFNQDLAQECADKAARIIEATGHGETLPRVTDDPASFSCRFCPFHGTCWK